MPDDKPILVAGAIGYVVGRLILALLDRGYWVRDVRICRCCRTFYQKA